jgi:hypothetical protein
MPQQPMHPEIDHGEWEELQRLKMYLKGVGVPATQRPDYSTPPIPPQPTSEEENGKKIYLELSPESERSIVELTQSIKSLVKCIEDFKLNI